MAERGRLANENTPKLRTFDARGNRRDEVEFHPAYHELMARSAHAGMHNSTWTAEGKPAGGAAEVVRAAKFYMAAQVETGHLCPITMTRASVAALAAQPDLLAQAMPKIATRAYDPGFAPWWTKRGMTLGMGMTEKQGGTDVRSNMTRADARRRDYRITGHKWFMSAPMCDAFLVLAQADDGLTCFFMPRFRPDGSVNAIQFQRLKDKLGNRSNASSEVEFDGRLCVARRRRGQGHPHHHPDGAADAAGLRDRLGRPDALGAGACAASRPLSQRVPETSRRSAADAGGAGRHGAACRGVDRAGDAAVPFVRPRARRRRSEAAYMRLLTPAIKYWVCKSAPGFLYEAMECLGGNGYVEEGILARHYREVAGQCDLGRLGQCDVPRRAAGVVARGGGGRCGAAALAGETAGLPGAAEAVAFIGKTFRRPDSERVARLAVEKLALLAAAAALNKVSPRHAELFAATRLAGNHASMYGAVDLANDDIRGLLERALP